MNDWDYFSDQPHVIRDKKYKLKKRSKNIHSLLYTLFCSVLIMPISVLIMPFIRAKKEVDILKFFVLCKLGK